MGMDGLLRGVGRRRMGGVVRIRWLKMGRMWYEGGRGTGRGDYEDKGGIDGMDGRPFRYSDTLEFFYV